MKSKNYAGAMVSAVDLDEFSNLCGIASHSMFQIIYDEMKDYIVPEAHPIPTTTQVTWWKPDTTTPYTGPSATTTKALASGQMDYNLQAYCPQPDF